MPTASPRRSRSVPRTRGSSQRSRPTRDRILDAAERLFAQRGFHGVSVRDITGAADVDVALANYHFGSKQGVLEAVLMRRAGAPRTHDSGQGRTPLQRLLNFNGRSTRFQRSLKQGVHETPISLGET